MIPFHIWLEKHAPTDVKTSAEHIETEDDSLVTEQESISVLEEKPEKEESSKTSTENVINQDTSLPEEGDQEDSFTTEICKEKLVSFTSEPVTEKKSVTEQQKKVDQKVEKQSKRIKKPPLLWKSFPETDACIDLAFFCENSDINGILSENQGHQAGLPSSEKKTLWKVLPKSEPCIDVSFFAQNIETQNVSMPAEERDESDSLKKEINTKNTVISASEPVTENKSVTETHKKMDQKGEKQSKTKRNKKKMIPFHIWLEKHAPTDVKTSAEHIETEDDSLVTEQESISVLEEKPDKDGSSKTSTEHVINQDTSLPEEGDQEDSFKTEICKEELSR
ncbi:PREDICTED: uncharacterized protein LOC106931542 [Poecilia mexicana]|uniref:uncharacterized protein LOC106931542 n=1 Tax=Poecilia mexicana TaxID=48701 RepID=UPI00072EBE29|nr:PREDICTED: uncharacterized protein LOC106931542 [Poecilia mexicana]